MKRIFAVLAVLAVLCATVVYAQPPPELPAWNENLRAELPKGMNATRYKEWIRVIYAAGVNIIERHGLKHGMVEGQRIPEAVFQCVMFDLGYDVAVAKGWHGIAAMAQEHRKMWGCDDDDPGSPGAVAAALIRDEEADFINRHGAKAKSTTEWPSADKLKEVSGKTATFTATVGTGAAVLFVLGSLLTGPL